MFDLQPFSLLLFEALIIGYLFDEFSHAISERLRYYDRGLMGRRHAQARGRVLLRLRPASRRSKYAQRQVLNREVKCPLAEATQLRRAAAWVSSIMSFPGCAASAAGLRVAHTSDRSTGAAPSSIRCSSPAAPRAQPRISTGAAKRCRRTVSPSWRRASPA